MSLKVPRAVVASAVHNKYENNLTWRRYQFLKMHIKSQNYFFVRLWVGDTWVFWLNEYFVEFSQIKILRKKIELNFLGEKLNKLLNWIFLENLLLNNLLNWVQVKNMKVNCSLNFQFQFLIKPLLFCLFWTQFGPFSGIFLIWPALMITWLLNWIIALIKSPKIFFNWIIIWIEFWLATIESDIELNQIFPKFALWIESY